MVKSRFFFSAKQESPDQILIEIEIEVVVKNLKLLISLRNLHTLG